MAMQCSYCIPFSILLLSFCSGAFSTTFTMTNNCGYTIWPGVVSNSGSATLATTGFVLAPGESRAIDAPVPWSGRFFARTFCSADPASGRFSCATGDCGTGAMECNGNGQEPPATLVEFTLGGGAAADTDFYDVSLVDGYNIPVMVVPQAGGCAPTGCATDLNAVCPADLSVVAPSAGGAVVACRSACEAFGTDRYCCSGVFVNPAACGPTPYSLVFKNACPTAYSYAYDDATSTFTCSTAAGGGYTVTFCPISTSLKSKNSGNPQAAGLQPINSTGIRFSGFNAASAAASSRGVLPIIFLFFLCVAALGMPLVFLHL